jgi:hypothetical protein
MTLPQPDQTIVALGALALAGLEGRATPIRIDAAIARRAVGGHGLGPLLWRALSAGVSASPEAKALLEGADRKNRLRIAGVRRAQAEIGQMFSEAGIAALAIKGLGLAVQLYPDIHCRNCGDLDILVRPQDLSRAASRLGKAGWRPKHPALNVDHPLFALACGQLKDVSMAHPGGWLSVELHKRLFFGDVAPHAPGMAAALKPLPFSPSEPLPVPPLSAGLACYLLLHGAVSRWTTLKHMVDIVPLLRLLPKAEWAQVVRWADRSATGPSIRASLILLSQVFGSECLGQIGPWVEAGAGQSSVRRRHAAYVTALNGSGRPGLKRWDQLQPDLQLADSQTYRSAVLGRAALSGGMRLASRVLARGASEGAAW